MLVHVILQAELLSPQKILVVVGKYKDIIETTLREYISLDKIEFIIQSKALGTGHAIQCCRDTLLQYTDTNVLILSGDTPLLQSATIIDMLIDFNIAKIVATRMDIPTGYGRIISKNGVFDKIVEEKDCSIEQKLVKNVNCGVYAFDSKILCKYLPLLTNQNAQNEYYLTDIIELIKNGEQIHIDLYDIPIKQQREITGVNTIEQLIELEEMITPESLCHNADFSERWTH
jgi:bifunctional N-acetylglucosamine-1-phosphate-uridyltransferase/glucosamine-1-phosphate-acetyltransferase GlmU-like protein